MHSPFPVLWFRAGVVLLLVALGAAGIKAQPARVPTAAWVLIQSERASQSTGGGFRPFFNGLAEVGFENGRNMRLELRYANGQAERYPELFGELARQPVDVFIAAGFQGINAAREVAQGRPVLAYFCGNDVQQMVTTFARPGGNVTGVACLAEELAPKRLELLREFLSAMTKAAYLFDPDVPAKERERRSLEATGERLGVVIVGTPLNRPDRIAETIAGLARDGIQGVLVSEDLFSIGNRTAIVQALVANNLPAAFAYRDFAVDGGLLSYGPSLGERMTQMGRYLGRLLQGARPRDLPIDQPTHFELVVNGKAARALGLQMPDSVLARADELIE